MMHDSPYTKKIKISTFSVFLLISVLTMGVILSPSAPLADASHCDNALVIAWPDRYFKTNDIKFSKSVISQGQTLGVTGHTNDCNIESVKITIIDPCEKEKYSVYTQVPFSFSSTPDSFHISGVSTSNWYFTGTYTVISSAGGKQLATGQSVFNGPGSDISSPSDPLCSPQTPAQEELVIIEKVGPLTLTTGKSSYLIGDKIVITGNVGKVIPGLALSLKEIKPDGTFFRSNAAPIFPSADGSFSYTWTTSPFVQKPGTWKTTIGYGSKNTVTSYQLITPPVAPLVVCGVSEVLESGKCVPIIPTCGIGEVLESGKCVAKPVVECGVGEVLESGKCVPIIPTCEIGEVLENNKCVPIQETSDDNPIGIIIGVIAAAVAAVLAIVIFKKKKSGISKQKIPKFCNKCGTPVTSSNKFCKKCGTNLSELTQAY